MIEQSCLQDIRQTKEYARFMEKIGWQAICLKESRKDTSEVGPIKSDTPPRWRSKGKPRGLKKETMYIFIKKLPLLPFSVAKILRYKKLPSLQKLKELSTKHKIIFTKIQPFAKETPEVFLLEFHSGIPQPRGLKNWRNDKHPLVPTKTIWINLNKTKEELLKKMKKKVRYSINFSKRKGVKTKIISGDRISSKKLNDFYKIWSKNKPFNWLFKANFDELKWLVESFGKNCFFVFASVNGQWSIPAKKPRILDQSIRMVNGPLSAVLILQSSNMAFDWFGANTFLGRKLLAKPLVLWKAIKESKNRGLKIFDFEGIYDKRFPKLNKGWIGFSSFKNGFGGKEVEFCQPLIKLLPGWTK